MQWLEILLWEQGPAPSRALARAGCSSAGLRSKLLRKGVQVLGFGLENQLDLQGYQHHAVWWVRENLECWCSPWRPLCHQTPSWECLLIPYAVPMLGRGVLISPHSLTPGPTFL